MRYLVVEPHPDDLAFFCGGTVAKLIAEGHEVETLVVTDGEQGTLDRSYDTDQKLAAVMREEQRAACEVLGVEKVTFLGLQNHFLEPTHELREKIVRHVRTVQPGAVISLDPWNFDLVYRPMFVEPREAIMKFFKAMILSLVGVLLLTRRIPGMAAGLRYHPLRSLLVGILSLIVIGLLAIPFFLLVVLLMLTIIGIPVAFIALLAIVGIILLTTLIPIYAFSYYTFEARGMNRYLSVAIWVGIAWLLTLLGSFTPFALVIHFAFFTAGLGTLVLTRAGARRVLSG